MSTLQRGFREGTFPDEISAALQEERFLEILKQFVNQTHILSGRGPMEMDNNTVKKKIQNMVSGAVQNDEEAHEAEF